VLPYRADPLTGSLAYAVPSRQHRPNLPAGCPFCPGGIEAPGDYDVRWFPNRWPSIPGGRCEVVLYSPVHEATSWSLGVERARKVVDLWAERSAALGARDDVAYVMPFENRGAEVGATIPHPHGQIYGFDLVPPVARAELDGADLRRALGPAAAGDGRLVSAVGGWRAWVPAAAISPYELVVAPEEPVADLPCLDDGRRTGLAAILVDVTARLDGLFAGPMPYLLWFHQRPFDGGRWPRAWVHAHLRAHLRAAGTPRFVAAAEIGSGIHFNPVDPARAAADLRAAGRP
jgi:UDPglucose--hexose-1-phosphate uridylyltransferase